MDREGQCRSARIGWGRVRRRLRRRLVSYHRVSKLGKLNRIPKSLTARGILLVHLPYRVGAIYENGQHRVSFEWGERRSGEDSQTYPTAPERTCSSYTDKVSRTRGRNPSLRG